MRRHAPPRPPSLRQFRERFGVRTLAQTEGDTRGLLHREIAGRKRVGVAEAEQQINIGGPRSDAMQCRECGVRDVGVHIANTVKIDAALGYGFADFPDRFDLGRRQAESLQFVDARAAHRVVMERLEGCKQPVANRGGTRGRELLPANNGAQSGKAALAPAQAEGTGFIRNRLESRVGEDKLCQGGFEIGLVVEKMSHFSLVIAGLQ